MVSTRRRLITRSGLFLVFAATLYGCGKPQSPESIVESSYRAIGKGEITEAKSYLSAQVVGMLGDAKLSAVLASQSQKIASCGGIKNVEVKLQGEGEVRAGTATVTFGGTCPPKTDNVKLLKENGKWKITGD